MDYGHPLVFGVQLDLLDPKTALETAQHVDELGYDYLAFAASQATETATMDPWTFASFFAGSTGSIQVRAQVPDELNPAVAARSSASLDKLAGGRTDILLGSLESNLSDDSLESLHQRVNEQLTIIREMWDGAEQRPLRFTGDYYRIPGTQRGPAPAHDVKVWIQGTGAEVLATAGELADGWVLETYSPQHEELVRALDAAAIAAGRDPREIRRQIVVKPEELSGATARDSQAFADALLELVTQGFSEYLFDTTDSQLLAWLAQDVKPLVVAELNTRRTNEGVPTQVLKSAAVRARRVGSINYDSLPAHIAAVSVEPGESTYSNYKNTYLRGGNPGLIINPKTAEHVQEAMKWIATQNVEFSIRSGGHGFSGKSTNNGGIVLNLRELHDVSVIDADQGLVRVGPGAQWAEVAQELEPYGLAISSGDSGSVGVGGLATVGGIGFFAKEHGLTIDYIRALEVVTADGRLVRASATENPELFWGMRGAGPNFGVVTAFEFEAQKVQEIANVRLVFSVENVAEFFEKYGKLVEETPRDTTLFLGAGGSHPLQPTQIQLYGVVNSADEETILSRLQPFAYLAPLVGQQVYLTTYAGAIGSPSAGPQHGQGSPISRAGGFEHLTPEVAKALVNVLESDVTMFFQIRTTGGAAGAVAEEATAYSGRKNTFHVLAMGTDRRRLDGVWEPVEELSKEFYLNFESDTPIDRVRGTFSPEKWERLVTLKREWDPTNLLKDNFNIVP